MPITAFSNDAQCELDLGQWLALQGFGALNDARHADIPPLVRQRAGSDVECSCCGARGATLVREARDRRSNTAVGQGHFRFRAADGGSPHDLLCDFFDEQNVRGREYLTSFASDRTALTVAIRDLVCRGIAAGLLSQAQMRAMRLWFLHLKASNAWALGVSEEDLRWCVAMRATRPSDHRKPLPFEPEHGLLPGFDWNQAACNEWASSHEQLLAQAAPFVFNGGGSISHALKLLDKHAGSVVLDPTALQSYYEAACALALFAADHVFEPPLKPPALVRVLISTES